MTSKLPPAEVLAARLEHELKTALIYTAADRSDMASWNIQKAQGFLAQLREAMK